MREMGKGSWPLHVSILCDTQGALALSIWPCICKVVTCHFLQELGGEGVHAGAGCTRKLGASLREAQAAPPEEGCLCLSGALVRDPTCLMS